MLCSPMQAPTARPALRPSDCVWLLLALGWFLGWLPQTVKGRGGKHWLPCAFPADHFHELYKVVLRPNQTRYVLPRGERQPYFSFAEIAKRGVEGSYSDSPVIRHASVANKWKTVHLLLHGGMNATTLQLNLTLQDAAEREFRLQLAIEVDTREGPRPNASTPQPRAPPGSPSTPPPEAEVLFEDVPEEKRFPRVRRLGTPHEPLPMPQVNVSLLPREAQARLRVLDLQLAQGDITVKGYNLSKSALLQAFLTSVPVTAISPATVTEGRRGHRSLDSSRGLQQPLWPALPAGIAEGHRLHRLLGASPSPVPEARAAASPAPGLSSSSSSSSALRRKHPPPAQGERNVAVEKEPQVEAGAADPRDPAAPLPGRRLQQELSGSYLGFLPWEKTKYFQDLLEVSECPLSASTWSRCPWEQQLGRFRRTRAISRHPRVLCWPAVGQ